MDRVKLFQKCPHCGFEFEVKRPALPRGGIHFCYAEKMIQKCPHCRHLVDIEY